MSSGRQLTPGFPCCSVPATLPGVPPVPGDTACGLREGFGSSKGKGHLFFIIIVSATGFLCSPGQVTLVLDACILPNLFSNPIPGSFHQWLEHVSF